MLPESELAPGIGPASFGAGSGTPWERLCAGVDTGGLDALEARLPSLPRHLGREQPWEQGIHVGPRWADFSHWRTCDVGAALLFRQVRSELESEPKRLRLMFDQGDAEERRMILRSLPFLDLPDVAANLLAEAHRTNDEIIFAAGLLDSDLAAAILDQQDWNRSLLKVAFLDLPVQRLGGWQERGHESLSSVLLDFRQERLAAGRVPWQDTLPVVALAPVAGLETAIEEDLGQSHAERRRAAADAALKLGGAGLQAAARRALESEQVAEIRALLERIVPEPGAR